MDVVIRDDLCEKEKNYIQKRLQTVKHWASDHGIPCKDNELPHVALLGSGGGQRAQIAFLGVLRQLAEDNLLGGILYLAGVSGSTWTMASLYDEVDWSGNVVDELVKKAFTNMSENQSSSFHDCLQWLKNRDHEGNLSLTDYWGVVTCFIKGVKLETRTLADEGQRDKGGATPYPLYSAVDKNLLHEKEKKELWFEMSPYESGFTEPGAFVETSLLKQPFKGGKVQMDSRRKPMDMVQLQGICGSAFGDGKTNIKFIIDVIKDWFQQFLPGHGVYNDIVEAALQLFEHYDDMELSYDTLARLSLTLCAKVDCFDVQSDTLKTLDREGWKAMTDEQKQQHIQRILEELDQSLPENPPERLKLMSWNDFKDATMMLESMFACKHRDIPKYIMKRE
ncbi:cytosolic phospholipase A2 gamma-like [Engraulis encrasicolus]|uniref:cytosolic phospholipase A2 gamma-like n=1 Tax=Engraulis encrasicolus TaxID=184585 RepID=UPI002FD1A9A3